MTRPTAHSPPDLEHALKQAVQDLVDRTGRSPHEIATTLDALLRQGAFGMTLPPEPGPLQAGREDLAERTPATPIDRRSIDQEDKHANATIDRAPARGQDRGQPVDDASSDAEDDALAWAQQAAERLGDPDGLLCFVALARRHRRDLLSSALDTALAVPHAKIRRSRAALFVALVQVRTRGSRRRAS